MFEYDYVDPSLLNEEAPKGSDNLVEGKAKFLIKIVLTNDNMGNPRKTKEGLPKFSLLHVVTDSKGNTGQIWKDISSKMQNTINDLGKCVGIELYNSGGKFNPIDLNGCNGECIIKMDKGNEKYKPKMTVDKYLPSSIKPVQKSSVTSEIDEDDDIPF